VRRGQKEKKKKEGGGERSDRLSLKPECLTEKRERFPNEDAHEGGERERRQPGALKVNPYYPNQEEEPGKKRRIKAFLRRKKRKLLLTLEGEGARKKNQSGRRGGRKRG